jgi:hypothetical protein
MIIRGDETGSYAGSTGFASARRKEGRRKCRKESRKVKAGSQVQEEIKEGSRPSMDVHISRVEL